MKLESLIHGADESKASIEEVEARAAYWDALACDHADPKLAKIASRRAGACRTVAQQMRKEQKKRKMTNGR